MADAATEVVDEAAGSYAWESELQRTWDAVEETADGELRSAAPGTWHARVARDRSAVHVGVKRGVMRAVFLIIDCSRHAADHDAEMKPTRLAVTCEAAAEFVRRFFDQNPVSTLSLLVTRRDKAEALTPLSCNARQHAQALKALASDSGCEGEASLQNALELARESLASVASFVSREVILLSSSLTTCDPGDLFATVASLAVARVRCSVYSLLAEVYIQRRIASATSGDYGVALSPAHLREMLMRLLPPRPISAAEISPANSLVKVGFPVRLPPGGQPALTFTGASAAPVVRCDGGFACPQCGVLHAEIPTECPICSLKLLSSTDLSKTYHHLFPLQRFTEAACPPAVACFGCGEALPTAARDAAPSSRGFRCEPPAGCGAAFCEPCDALLHEALHACPACQMRPPPSPSGSGPLAPTLDT